MSNVQCVFACACSIQLCSWTIFHTECTTVRMSSLYLSMVLHSSMTLYPEPEKYIRNSKLFLAVTIGCFKRRATFEPKQHKPTPTFREHRFLLSIDRKTISRLVRTIIRPQLNGCNLGKLLRRKTLKRLLTKFLYAFKKRLSFLNASPRMLDNKVLRLSSVPCTVAKCLDVPDCQLVLNSLVDFFWTKITRLQDGESWDYAHPFLICSASLSLWLNPLLHKSQRWMKLPVCSLRWCVRPILLLNLFSHKLHGKVIPLCFAMWWS